MASKEQVSEQEEFSFKNVQLFKDEILGIGSYEAVYRARCDQLICAAKILHPVLSHVQAIDQGKEHRQPFNRFQEECRLLRSINHPNIVQYLGKYRDPETNAPVLLMELMDESLTHYLELSAGDIPYHIQVSLVNDIAQALAFLHANGIIHRDLSSNNVLLLAGRAKLTDFGMVKLNKQRASMTQCPGTTAFMPPEALDDSPVYANKMDIFSLGVIIVQILTRKLPEPARHLKMKEISDSQNRAISVQVKVPEVERRQAHISLIEPSHPLRQIALDCLKDLDNERPSSQQLCKSLTSLKATSKHSNMSKLLQEKDFQIHQCKETIEEHKDRLLDQETKKFLQIHWTHYL